MLKKYVVTAKGADGEYRFNVRAKNYREAADAAELVLGEEHEDEIVRIAVVYSTKG